MGDRTATACLMIGIWSTYENPGEGFDVLKWSGRSGEERCGDLKTQS